MSDDLKIRSPQDPLFVNVNQPWEVQSWCHKFKCTEAQLRAAVRAVGTSAAKVGAYLGHR